MCFERNDDAQAYLRALRKRLEKFGLQLAEEKSSLVKFNRWEPDQSGKFTFLGFDFYWGRSRKCPQYVNVRRRTNRKKFQASLLALKEWLKKARSLRLPDLLAVLRRKLRGYWNYYGVRGNSKMLAKYQYEVYLLLFKWSNRSQRRSMTQKSYTERWKTWDIPTARIIEEYPKKPLTHRHQPA